MEEEKKPESHMTSAAAFVEGGIQDPCDDACSICLEEFTENDPSTVTDCKHEFHLQCILEWCQRSSQCPMCWQAISLKDPTSQELLTAVERERNVRLTPMRNTTIFHHPTLGDFELRHLPVGANDPEIEERIIQHLAAAAAMGRAHHAARREGPRTRSSHGRPHFLVFSTQSNAPHSGHFSSSPSQAGGDADPAAITVASPSSPLSSDGNQLSQQSPTHLSSSTASGSPVVPTNRQALVYSNRSSSSQSTPPDQDRAGPSELQSFSESLKARFNAVSMRYKDSISKSARGWKDRLFSRNSSMSDIGSEVRREVNAGIASVSRMMECLETRENSRDSQATAANPSAESSLTQEDNQRTSEDSHGENTLNNRNTPTSAAASSVSN